MRYLSAYLPTLFFIFLLIAITAPDSSSSNTPCSYIAKENITKGFPGNSTNPSISRDGSVIAFESAVDVTENNPGGTYQIFIYDTKSGKATQITDDEKWGSVTPSISADGKKVAFVSAANIKGNNPEALNEIYIYDIDTADITQVSQTGNSFEPSLNEDGSVAAFTSNMNTSTNTSEIFVFDSLSATTTQVTDFSSGGSVHPQISASGRFVVYQSSTTIEGDVPDTVSNIFLFDTVSGKTTQVTESREAIGSISASISSEGNFVAFQSDSDVNKDNPHKSFNIYLFDTVDENLIRITREPGAGNAGASIDKYGSAVAFQSSGDFTNKNPDGNLEIFLYFTNIEEFYQVTDTDSNIENTGAVISGDGAHVVYVSENASEEENPEQKSDIYLASCSNNLSLPGASPGALNWVIMAAAFVLVIFLFVKFGKRSKA